MPHKKLLLIGSSGSIHLKNYYFLVKDYFQEIVVVSNVKVEYCKYKTFDFSLKKPWLLFQKVKQMKRLIQEIEPTHIHVHQAGNLSYITALANQRRTPFVLTAWGSDVLIVPHRNRLFKHLIKFSLKKADFITADADFMAEAIYKLVNKEVYIANFGIEYNNEDIPEKKNIVYSNRLHKPLYRVDEIISGFAKFYENNKNWKIVIGANGSETEKLVKLAKSLLPTNAFEFVGFVSQEENKEWYLNSHIWISNPESDGTAISLLEAMGYGCIPVVSDLPANNEWITQGENGQIVTDSIEVSLQKAKEMDLVETQARNINIILKTATKSVNKKKFEAIYDRMSNLQNSNKN